MSIDRLVKAWNNVSCKTIVNCWKKTKILLPSMFENILVPSTLLSNSTMTDNIIINSQKTKEEIQDLINKLPYNNILNADEYININNISENIDLTNKKIVNIIQDKKKTEILLYSMFENILVPSTLSLNSTITDDIIINLQKTEEKIQDLINKLPYNNILNADEYININNMSRNVDLTNEKIVNIIQDK
ncbi:934_t:CDS:2, partial [Dentiscutata erythropus]